MSISFHSEADEEFLAAVVYYDDCCQARRYVSWDWQAVPAVVGTGEWK